MTSFAMCKYLWDGWVVLWLLWSFQSKRAVQRASISSRLSYGIFVCAALYFVFFADPLHGLWLNPILPYSSGVGFAGVAITVLGIAFSLWARLTLGGNWSGAVTIKEGHELIQRGPYRIVRHPIYTGMLIALTGTVLAHDQVAGLAALLLLWIGFTIKRLKEEQFMRQTFGPPYIAYSRTTPAIIPNPFHRHN